MDSQRPITMPPVIGGSGSDGPLPFTERVKDTLPPVIGPGNPGVGEPPQPRPFELPPVIG